MKFTISFIALFIFGLVACNNTQGSAISKENNSDLNAPTTLVAQKDPIKKFVARTFKDLGFLKDKQIVELFKSKRKKRKVAN